MHHFLKRLITPLAILLTTQIQSVGAETIRLVGPDGNIQSAPQYSQPIDRNTTASAVPSNNTYGPTRADETLWSIATRLRPSNAVSIQQTLLAIYRLNPQAFDNQNIHELIPGSNLRVPSLAQARAESTEAARRILEQHQQKLGAPLAQPATRPAPAVRVIEPKAEPVAKPEPEKAEVKEVKPVVETKPEPKPVAPTENRDVSNLKDKLSASEGELVALEEKNHNLRMMISDLQGELGNLKEELGDESRIRSEVEKMLEEERKRQAELEAMQPSQLDLLIENKLFVALLALVPGSVLVLALVMFLTRRRREDEVGQMPDEAQVIDLTEDEDIQEINLDESIDDDLNIEDDLFGEDSEENIFDVEDTGSDEENDIFANLDDSDLDFNLDDGEDPFASIDDNGELGDAEAPEASSNGISVDGDDKALSLEEMERALDEGVSEPSTSDAEVDDFDLSDDEISQDELNELLATDDPTEALDADELDQSMLDDLFNQAGDSQQEDDQNGLDFESLLSEEPLDESAFELSEDADDGEPVLKDEEIDDLLAELEPEESVLEEPAFEAQDTDVDFQDDSGDMLSDFAADDVIGEESIDLLDEIVEDELAGDEELPEFDENSTELLDELIDEEEPEIGDFDLGSESTALLDEIVDSEEDDETLPEITDNTTELLDELLGDDEEEESFQLDDESTALLDELVDDGELSEEAGIELDENSTELLDELMEDEDFAVDEDLAINNDIAQTDISDLSKDDSDIPDVLLEGFEEPESEPEPADELDLNDGGEFEFSPEIEAAEYNEPTEEPVAESEPELEEVSEEVATSASEQDVQANEFGVPQDDDWLADDFESEAEAASVQEPESEPEQAPAFDEILADSIEQQEAEQLEAEVQPQDLAEPEFHAEELADIADEVISEPEVQEAFEAPVAESPAEDQLQPEPHADELAEITGDDEISEFDEQAAFEELVSDSLGEELTPHELHTDELAEITDDEIGELDEQVSFEELITENLEHHEAERHEAEFEPEADEFAQISDDDLGEFDEMAALEAAAEEEGEELVVPETEAELDELLEISDDDLGEFDEMAAFEAAAEEEGEELVVPETEAELDELFEISDDDLGEFDEMAALEAAAEEEGEELAAPETEAELDELFEISDDDLGEFDEVAAFEAAAEAGEELAIPEAEAESDESFEISDDELGEFDESALLDELLAEDLEPEATEVEIPKAEVPEPMTEESNEQAFDELDELLSEVENGAFDESAMAELLDDEPTQDTAPLASQELDSETIDSAGMDLGAMLDMGEDWNGFNLSPEQQAEIPEEVPEDQQAIWGAESEEPKVQEEDWGNQPSVDELETSDNQFMSVDELMAQVESSENESDPDEEELNLDVGLNEFPDVIGNIEQFDVDAGGEAAGKLDLAKIYIEMNDNEGAIKLLEEAIVYGEDATRQEAKALIDKLNGQ